jgi:sRNA-binding carbon storage regulator CsrA
VRIGIDAPGNVLVLRDELERRDPAGSDSAAPALPAEQSASLRRTA